MPLGRVPPRRREAPELKIPIAVTLVRQDQAVWNVRIAVALVRVPPKIVTLRPE
jgi:hypothetical protein